MKIIHYGGREYSPRGYEISRIPEDFFEISQEKLAQKDGFLGNGDKIYVSEKYPEAIYVLSSAYEEEVKDNVELFTTADLRADCIRVQGKQYKAVSLYDLNPLPKDKALNEIGQLQESILYRLPEEDFECNIPKDYWADNGKLLLSEDKEELYVEIKLGSEKGFVRFTTD